MTLIPTLKRRSTSDREMEGGKQSGSSLASDLFGAKDSSTSSSSSGLFSSIFALPSEAVGRELKHSHRIDKKKNDNGNPAWSARNEVSEKKATGSEGQLDICSYYKEQKVMPFHYNSSIYYGGQDLYSQPQAPQNPVFTTFKDGREDDSAGASRGNWWQGSLYY